MEEIDTLITGLLKACALTILTAALGVFIAAGLGIWVAVFHIAADVVTP